AESVAHRDADRRDATESRPVEARGARDERRARIDRAERVPEVVADGGDELLAIPSLHLRPSPPIRRATGAARAAPRSGAGSRPSVELKRRPRHRNAPPFRRG